MAVTTTIKETLQSALDEANPNKLADALQKVQLGTLLKPLKRTFTGLTAAAAFDLTAIDGTGETAGATNPNRLPALLVGTLRATAVGTAAAGPRHVTDAGGTAGAPGANGPGIALISDDGKTITFEGTVTAFVIEYVPRSAADLTSDFARS